MEQLLRSVDLSKQISALKELESFHLPQAVPMVLPLLHSPHDTLREQAAHTIGRLTPTSTAEVGGQLIALLADHNELVRYEVAASLGLLRNPPAIGILRQIMLDNSGWLVRIAATEALDKFAYRALFADFQATFERLEQIDTEEAFLIQISVIEALIHVAIPEDVSI